MTKLGNDQGMCIVDRLGVIKITDDKKHYAQYFLCASHEHFKTCYHSTKLFY